MAKIKGPLFSIGAMGKIGDDLIYRKRKGINDVKKYTKTINPNTPGQQSQKGFFKNAIDAWSVDGYSEADKLAWNQFAKTKKVITSGFNRFTGLKIDAEKEGSTWSKLTNCIIYDVTGAGFKVDVEVGSDLSGVLYLGTSKYSMLTEFIGIFSVNKYTFTITGVPDETKVYFYIKNKSIGEGARTGIYSHYHVGGFVPSPIDIGSPAIDRPSYEMNGKTYILLSNPADGSGKITTIEVWAYVITMTGVKVATFYELAPSYFTTRDYQAIGPITPGSKQTFPVDIEVETGDFIGIYWSVGALRFTTTGGGMRRFIGDYIPCNNQGPATYVSGTLSLYGIGETTP